MPRKFPTQLEKLQAAGYDATITPAAEPLTRARNNSYILNLTDSAKLSAVDLGTIAVLILQKNEWELAVNNGDTPPINPLSPIEYQELLYELINMAQYIENRPVLTYLNIVTPVNGVINLPNPPGRFITFAQAQAENLPMSNPLPTVNGYTAKLTDYYHILAVPFQVPQKGDKGDIGDKGDKGDIGLTGEPGPIGLDGATGATGAAGIDGANGANGANGENGATGPTGATGTTGATGATGATGTTGKQGNNATPPEPITGSGTNGSADQNDTYVELPACLTFFNLPYGSAGVNYIMQNIKPQLLTVLGNSGKFNSATEDVISANIGIKARSDVGGAIAGVNLATFLGQNRELSITDSAGRGQKVYFTEETYEVPIPVVGGAASYHIRNYSQASMIVKLQPATIALALDGRLNKDRPSSDPPNENDTAWAAIEVCSFVKKAKAACPTIIQGDFLQSTQQGQQYWPNSGFGIPIDQWISDGYGIYSGNMGAGGYAGLSQDGLWSNFKLFGQANQSKMLYMPAGNINGHLKATLDFQINDPTIYMQVYDGYIPGRDELDRLMATTSFANTSVGNRINHVFTWNVDNVLPAGCYVFRFYTTGTQRGRPFNIKIEYVP